MYTVPKSKKSLKQNKFEITFEESGKSYSLPKFKFIKPDVAARADDLGPVAGIRFLINELAPGLFAEFEDLDQLNAFQEEWQKDSGVTAGESGASAAS